MMDPKEKNILEDDNEESVFDWNKYEDDFDKNIASNGSGNAFDETERVNEDNFDDLREK